MKLVQYSDNHQKFGAAKAAHAHAKKIGASAIIGSGDFFEENVSKMKVLKGIDRAVVQEYMQLEQMKLRNKGISPEQETKFKPIHKKIRDQIEKDATEVYRAYNAISAHYGIKTLVVMGNHDIVPAMKKEWKNATYLNEQTANINGFKIAGLNNTYEVVPSFYDPKFSEGIVDDQPVSSLDQYLNQGMQKEDLMAQIADEIKQQPSYQRIVSAKPNMLVYHNPPNIGNATVLDNGQGNCESGILAEQIARELKVPVLCGHIHEPKLMQADGIPIIRCGNEYLYEIEVNDRTKKIEYITVYKLVPKREQQAEPTRRAA